MNCKSVQGTMSYSVFTRRWRRRRGVWPPTITFVILLLTLLLRVGADNGTTVPAIFVITTASSSSSSSSSVQSTSSSSSSSSPIPVCNLFLVPASPDHHLHQQHQMTIKSTPITTNASSSSSSSSQSLNAPSHNLSTSALLYIHEFPDSEEPEPELQPEHQQQQQQQQQQLPTGLYSLDVQLSCSSDVHNDTIAAVFQNGIHIFEGTLLQLKEFLAAPDNPGQHSKPQLHHPNQLYSQPSIDDPRQETLDSNSNRTVLWNVLLLLGYGLILLVSLPGNLLVCRIIISTPKLRTTTNILILSLTVSDIATTVFNIPFMCARTMLRDWPLPDCFCLLMPTVQVCSVYVSTFTMAAIGIHRFRAVRVGPLMMAAHHHNHRRGTSNNNVTAPNHHHHQAKPYSPYVMTKAKIVLWIVGIWVASILLALPHSLFNQVVDDSPSPFKDPQGWSRPARRCRAMYPPPYENTINLILSLETSLTQYLLPLTVTAVLYTKIALIIQRQGQLARHFCDELNRRAVEAKRKRISMLIIVVAAFAISWAPLNFYHLLIDLHQISFDYSVFMVLHQLAMLSVCYNPFIYCWMNEAFRVRAKKYLRLVGKICPCLGWICCPGGVSKKKGRRGGKQSRNLRSCLICSSGGGGGRRSSSTGMSTIGGADEEYSLSGVGGGNGGGGFAGNNTTATTTTTLVTTRVSSFTRLPNNHSNSSFHPSASAATIIDPSTEANGNCSLRPQWTVQ